MLAFPHLLFPPQLTSSWPIFDEGTSLLKPCLEERGRCCSFWSPSRSAQERAEDQLQRSCFEERDESNRTMMSASSCEAKTRVSLRSQRGKGRQTYLLHVSHESRSLSNRTRASEEGKVSLHSSSPLLSSFTQPPKDSRSWDRKRTSSS